MNTIVLLLGGNLGDVMATCNTALTRIRETIGAIISESSVYESPSWGFKDSRPFLNKAVVVSTQKSAHDCLRTCLRIEEELGRTRTADTGYTARIIDIDILFYNSEIIETKELTVPHPLLHKRRFALEPLQEIVSGFIHPVLGVSIQNLLDLCEDTSYNKIIL